MAIFYCFWKITHCQLMENVLYFLGRIYIIITYYEVCKHSLKNFRNFCVKKGHLRKLSAILWLITILETFLLSSNFQRQYRNQKSQKPMGFWILTETYFQSLQASKRVLLFPKWFYKLLKCIILRFLIVILERISEIRERFLESWETLKLYWIFLNFCCIRRFLTFIVYSLQYKDIW